MNRDLKTINLFISKNPEFAKVIKQGKSLKIKLKGSEFEYEPADFSLNSLIRKKLNELETNLGIPVT